MDPSDSPSSTSREQELARTLKRCSRETLEAAIRFQTTHDPDDLSKVILGVLERELPETHTERLAAATDSSRIVDDLGLDSFGMMELVMTAEEVFGITIENHDLRKITTLGELKAFVLSKLAQPKSPP